MTVIIINPPSSITCQQIENLRCQTLPSTTSSIIVILWGIPHHETWKLHLEKSIRHLPITSGITSSTTSFCGYSSNRTPPTIVAYRNVDPTRHSNLHQIGRQR